MRDTLVAGCFHNDKKAVDFIVKSAPTVVRELISGGMRFDMDAVGVLALKREGGHGMHRIVHYRDYTGKKVSESLIKNVRLNKNITVLENTFVTDLLVRGGVCYGARVISGGGFKKYFRGEYGFGYRRAGADLLQRQILLVRRVMESRLLIMRVALLKIWSLCNFIRRL